MNNTVFSILPFLLFGFICAILTRERFSLLVTRIVWAVVIVVVSVVHLGVGLASYDSSLIISLMPVTAYLPLIIATFILSKRCIAGNIFAVSVALLADVTAGLVRKLFVAVLNFLNAPYGVWADVAMAVILTAVCAAIGFIVFRWLRKIFRAGDIVENKNWYILFVCLLPVALSLYQISSVSDITAIILLLAADICVFGVIVAYIVARAKNLKLQAEQENIRRQIELEREEYRITEQKLELGRQYRHDMRHHFAAIRGLLKQGDTAKLEQYLNSLDDGSSFEQRAYCKNSVINAVMSALLERAERAGIAVSARVKIPEEITFESSDLSIVLANAVENSINACAAVADGERVINLTAECEGGKFTLCIENTVASHICLGEDGLPLTKKTEEHGHGLSSIKYIVDKYSGVMSCNSTDDRFTIKLVLFGAVEGQPVRRRRRTVARVCAAVPVTLLAAVLTLNCLPSTASALERIPVLGSAISAVDFRTWGFGWGDSQLNVTYPQTGDGQTDKTIADYVDECVQLYFEYFGLRDQGYVGTDITSSIVVESVDMLVISVSATYNLGGSASNVKYFVIDRQSGGIIDFADLFKEDSDYMQVVSAEITRQIVDRVENYYENFYGYGIFADEKGFSTLKDPDIYWTYYINGSGLLVIVFGEYSIAPGNTNVTFTIPHTVTDAIADPEGLLGGAR